MTFKNSCKFPLLILIASCNNSINEIQPKMINTIDDITQQIATTVSFKAMSVEAVKKEETGFPDIKELNIWITNAAVKSYTAQSLDSLSHKIAIIIKKNITNANTYHWLNIIYLTDDGTNVSDATKHTAFVFRPNEIK